MKRCAYWRCGCMSSEGVCLLLGTRTLLSLDSHLSGGSLSGGLGSIRLLKLAQDLEGLIDL